MSDTTSVNGEERSSKTLRVMLVDDNWNFLGSAEHFLSSEPDVEIVGCASSGAKLSTRCRT